MQNQRKFSNRVMPPPSSLSRHLNNLLLQIHIKDKCLDIVSFLFRAHVIIFILLSIVAFCDMSQKEDRNSAALCQGTQSMRAKSRNSSASLEFKISEFPHSSLLEICSWTPTTIFQCICTKNKSFYLFSPSAEQRTWKSYLDKN